MVTRIVRPGRSLQSVAIRRDGQLLAGGGASSTDTKVLLWDLADPRRPVRLRVSLRATPRRSSPPRSAPTVDPGDWWGGPHGTAVGCPRSAPTEAGELPDLAREHRLHRGIQPRRADPRRRRRRQHRPTLGCQQARGADSTRPAPAHHGLRQVCCVRPARRCARRRRRGRDGPTGRLPDQDTPALAGPVLTGATSVESVSFSPDGHLLTAGSQDGALRVWDSTDAERPTSTSEPLTNDTGWVNGMAFSSDTQLMASANSDNFARLWDPVSGQLLMTLQHPEPVMAVALIRHDELLMTSSADGVVRIWEMPGPVMPGAGRTIASVSFRADGRLLASVGSDVRLWDVTNPRRPSRLGDPLLPPVGLGSLAGTGALSPDGRTFAAGSRSPSNVVLWDITDSLAPRQFAPPLTGPTALVESIAFSPDGATLAAGGDDGLVHLWDVTDPEHARALSAPNANGGYVFMVAFSPDSQTLAAATVEGTVRLWDVSDPGRPRALGKPLASSADYLYSLAFSPDGRTLAAGSADSTIQLWDVTRPERPAALGEPIADADGRIFSLAFSADGRFLAAGTGSGRAWLWDLTNPASPKAVHSISASSQAVWAIAFARTAARWPPEARQESVCGTTIRIGSPGVSVTPRATRSPRRSGASM